MFPSLGSALSAHHLLSSPPVPLRSLYWYGLLSVHSHLLEKSGVRCNVSVGPGKYSEREYFSSHLDPRVNVYVSIGSLL